MDHSVKPVPRVGAVIQARMGSTRLPGKSLLPLPLPSGPTVLAHVINRARCTKGISAVVVATTTLSQDDVLAAAAAEAGAVVFRGSEHDVLDRFCSAAVAFELDVVVRLTADNPAVDPHYVGLAVAHHLANGLDYTLTAGLPLGTNTEVINRTALATAAAQAQQHEEREHVTPYLRRHPELFRSATFTLALPEKVSQLRLTLDFPSDYALLQTLFTSLPLNFSLLQLEGLLRQYPWLPAINSHNQQVSP
ncbi:cytidylyltransferase domain-containing protein [Hymenobacter koreensis]|uniref:Spore coat polysaccharide biosynthesis protein SpsF n=1 Tax=Hymenobacter koreensis TaxID=1084523 RepID=A0ABP8JBC8_9BACT